VGAVRARFDQILTSLLPPRALRVARFAAACLFGARCL